MSHRDALSTPTARATRGEEVDDQNLDKQAREFAEKF